MARPKQGTPKRATAAEKVEAKVREKQRRAVVEKAAQEMAAYNVVVDKANDLRRQSSEIDKELTRRQGRLEAINEEMMALGGIPDDMMDRFPQNATIEHPDPEPGDAPATTE